MSIQADNLVSDTVIADLEHKVEAGELASIEQAARYTLADAIRDGATVTDPYTGWSDGERAACALSAAHTALRARRIL